MQLIIDKEIDPAGRVHRTSGVGGWRCSSCAFDTLSRCLACDVACCGTCLIRHECES